MSQVSNPLAASKNESVNPSRSTARLRDDRWGTQLVKFSIVTPTLNAAQYLQECLDSVASQRGPGVEIEHLVLDGGSTDGTLQLLEQANVRHIARSPQDNVVRAMCLGYDAAEGDLVGFLGADDLYLPGALQRVAETYRREQRPLIFSRARWTDGQLRTLGELAPPPRWLTASIHAALGWNYLGAANSFVTPELYRELGGFDQTVSKAEDYEFYTRTLARGIPYSCLNEPVCIFRRHGSNESLKQNDTYFRDLKRIRDLYGVRSPLLNSLVGNAFRTWIYWRNPQWALHQVSRKITERRFRG